MNRLLAHVENLHSATTSELEHVLTAWYVAIPVFFGVVLLLWWLMSAVFKQSIAHKVNLTLLLFFATGVLTFSLVPALSIITLSLGIMSALLVVLSSLAK